MRFTPCGLEGAMLIDVEWNTDERGGFGRTFSDEEFAEHGLPTRFPHCNLSTNPHAGTLRGMHFNADPFGESKLVRCVRGSIHDVIIDLRSDSDTRLGWLGMELSARNARALFVPVGFAHGYVTLEDETDVYYHMGSSFVPGASRGIRWNDPTVGIEWPIEPLVISKRDASYADLEMTSFDWLSSSDLAGG